MIERGINKYVEDRALYRHRRNVIIKEEYPELIFQALEEVKPPSKWKEILLYFSLALLGGVGLGLFLAFRHLPK